MSVYVLNKYDFEGKNSRREKQGDFLADMISKLTLSNLNSHQKCNVNLLNFNAFEIEFIFYDDFPQRPDSYFILFPGHS